MRSPMFTLSLALWLVFFPSSSSYGVTPTSLPYWTTEQPFQWRNWWETTEEPFLWINWWDTTSPPYRFTPTEQPYQWGRTLWETTSPTYMVTSAPHWRGTFYPRPYVPDPSVEVYQQVGNSKSLIVVCQFGTKTGVSSFHLSVRNGDGNRMLNGPACIAETMCVFNITVTPPVSFTCVHVVSTHRDVQTLLSDIFTYQPHNASEQLKPQVSPFYIGFASFIGVGLIILVTMLVVTTLLTRHKGSRREVKENVYAPTEII